MEKRYQVFVSSTYEDLKEERSAVMQALLALDCIPTGMELFPAADEGSWDVIRRFIKDCDYYVVIVGGRYGSSVSSGSSFTELEYDFAVEAQLPILAFLHGDPGKIAADRTEQTETGKRALAEFRKKIEGARHAKYWSSSEGLPGTVAISLANLMRVRPRIGWVRGDSVPDKNSALEILGLRRKVEELEKQLETAAASPPSGVEDLSQGDEAILVRVHYVERGRVCEEPWNLSWNEIVSLVGPVLIGGASERALKHALTEALRNRRRGRIPEPVYHLSMVEEDFQRIKLQLRALHIIREADEPRDPNEGKAFHLTPYGDRLVTKVGAIKSSTRTTTG